MIKGTLCYRHQTKNSMSNTEQGRPLTGSRPMTESYLKSESAYLGFYWFLLFVIALSVVSLACALFGFGIVFELQAGWRVYHTFYSYMVMFPLLGNVVIVVFGMAASGRRGGTMSFVLTVVAVIYLIVLAAIIGYLIFDWVAHCNATTAAPHCWNGLTKRWQWEWMFWSIVAQFVLMILELVLGLKILGIAHRLMTAGVIESRIPTVNIGREKSPIRLSDYDPMTRQFIHAVNSLK
jgi:MFS family permease